jgi:hypothetical protein
MKKYILAGFALAAATAFGQNNISLPAGTSMTVKLETTLATFSNKPGDPFQARVTQPLLLNGQTLVPIGATVEGRVTKVTEPRRISGKPTIGLFPETLIMPTGQRFMLNATVVDTNIGHGSDVNAEGQFKGSGHDGKDQIEAGMGAGGGMLIGGLIGGGPGLLIGGAVAGSATVVHWLAKHRSAILPAGTELTMEINRPLTLNTAAPGQ